MTVCDTARNRKVLFIAYHYPPDGSVGVMRTVKFLKYLPSFGWEPTVLTLKTDEYLVRDETLASKVARNVEVFRVPETGTFVKRISSGMRINPCFDFPDVESRWIPQATLEGKRIIEQKDISVIYTTGPPHSTHLVGLLCKLITGMPWVADFRDTWFGNCFFVPEKGIKRRLHGELEKHVVKRADLTLANTEYALKEFQERYPAMREKFFWLPNGFDPEDFENPGSNRTNRDKFRMTYVGSTCEERRMDFFLQALKELLADKPERRHKIEFVFVGFDSVGTMELAREYGLEDIVTFRGHLPHKEAIRCMFESDVLLLFLFESHGGSAALPSKVFEYMKAGKPVFAQVCRGATADFVRDYKGGYVVDPEDVAQIKETILTLCELHETGKLTTVEDPDIARFDRVALTEQLCSLFTQVLGDNGNRSC